MPSSDDTQLLTDARAKAKNLLDALIAQRQDLDRFADHLAPDKLAQGRQAFANAIESARQALDGIDQALATGAPSSAGQ
jgi:ABC-type transporter Mla subunit MlaD